MSHEAPLFITSRPVGVDANSLVLDTWAGSEHLVAPHVNAASSQKLETVDEWVTLSAARRPWIVRLPLLNHYFPEGVWRVLSSPAYLRQPVSFILFSLGLLVPQQQSLSVNIMGLYCRKNVPALQRAQHGHGDWIVKYRAVSSKERWSDVVLQDPVGVTRDPHSALSWTQTWACTAFHSMQTGSVGQRIPRHLRAFQSFSN